MGLFNTLNKVTKSLTGEQKTVVVHHGSAHRDDLLSVAVVLSTMGSVLPVYRRDPTQADLNNPHTWVIDCGRQYDPDKKNFDHHQFDRNHAPECALSLLNKSQGFNLELLPWYDFTVTSDSKGPKVAASSVVGTDADLLPTISPVEGVILKKFSEYDGEVDYTIAALIKELGDSILCDAVELMVNLRNTKN